MVKSVSLHPASPQSEQAAKTNATQRGMNMALKTSFQYSELTILTQVKENFNLHSKVCKIILFIHWTLNSVLCNMNLDWWIGTGISISNEIYFVAGLKKSLLT